MIDDLDNLEHELASLRPAPPGESLRHRVAAAIAAVPVADPLEVRPGDDANHGRHPKGPAPLRHPALERSLLRRLAIAAGLAVAAVIAFAVFLGRGTNVEPQRTHPAPKEIVAKPANPPSPQPEAEASLFTWLACHRAAAVSEEALGALLDEQARRMPAMAGGLLALRADLSQPN